MLRNVNCEALGLRTENWFSLMWRKLGKPLFDHYRSALYKALGLPTRHVKCNTKVTKPSDTVSAGNAENEFEEIEALSKNNCQ